MLGTAQSKTFTEGQGEDGMKKQTSKIFAEALAIDQSPSKINIDNQEKDEDVDSKNLLANLMNESESSSEADNQPPPKP